MAYAWSTCSLLTLAIVLGLRCRPASDRATSADADGPRGSSAYVWAFTETGWVPQ